MRLTWLLVVAVISGCQTDTSKDELVPRFSPGQVWRYQTRPEEPESRVIIVAVDSHETLGTIVHVYVNGLSLASPPSPGGVAREISHMPFSAEALSACLIEVEESGVALPDYQEGYDAWKSAFEAGEAGVFTVSVAEAIEAMESSLNQ